MRPLISDSLGFPLRVKAFPFHSHRGFSPVMKNWTRIKEPFQRH